MVLQILCVHKTNLLRLSQCQLSELQRKIETLTKELTMKESAATVSK